MDLREVSVPFVVVCPYCRKHHNMGFHVTSAGETKKETPIPGDFVCCVDCEGWSVHDPKVEGNLRSLSDSERVELTKLRSYQRIESALHDVQRDGGGGTVN